MDYTKHYTMPELGRHLTVPRHRLEHALKRDNIQPAQRVGPVRLYSSDQLPAIRTALAHSFQRWTRARGR